MSAGALQHRLLCYRAPEEEHWNISKFAQEMFEFGAGGRIHGLWTTWGAVTKEDRRGVCGRDDVRQHCIEWPSLNLETFSSL